MGFWDAVNGWSADMRAQRAVDSAFEQGKAKGQQDMTRWCHNLQEIIFEEVAGSVGQRVVLDKTLEELRRLDPDNWLLVKENRSRIATGVRDEAVKHAHNGIASPGSYVYFRRPDGFLERRVADWAGGEAVGIVRERGGKSTAMTMEELGLTKPG
jgi:hypothetical protein